MTQALTNITIIDISGLLLILVGTLLRWSQMRKSSRGPGLLVQAFWVGGAVVMVVGVAITLNLV